MVSSKVKIVLLAVTAFVLVGCGKGADWLTGEPATPKPSPKPTSPGAGKIAYLSVDGSFWLVTSDNKERRLLFYDPELTGKTGLHFDWSPDASKIIMDGLQLIDLKTGEIKEYPKGEVPKWSPTGDRILITGAGFEFQNLYLMKADGSESKQIDENVILDWGVNHSRNWSPKGDGFIYSKAIEDELTGAKDIEIWIADAEGENKRKLLDADRYGMADIRYPTWSPKGNWIAFTFRSTFDEAMSDTSNIALISANASNLELVTRFTDPRDSVLFPTWLPDGKNLVWIVENIEPQIGGLWKINIEKKEQSQIFDHRGGKRVAPIPPSISPNSRETAVLLVPGSPPSINISCFPPENQIVIADGNPLTVWGPFAQDREVKCDLFLGSGGPFVFKMARLQALGKEWWVKVDKQWLKPPVEPVDGTVEFDLSKNKVSDRLKFLCRKGNCGLRELELEPLVTELGIYKVRLDGKGKFDQIEAGVLSYQWSPI
jgi:hypothetical protein